MSNSWLPCLTSSSACLWLRAHDFFSEVLGPGRTRYKPGMRVCVDFPQQPLARFIRVSYVLQVDRKLFFSKLRSSLYPNPVEFRNPRSDEPSFQRHCDFLVAVLDCDF